MVLCALWLAGCSVNPATGDRSFTAFMSPEQEKQLGREEHPKIVESFGGAYDDPALARYVDGLGQLLARTSEAADTEFTFTVLDSPMVNAFAVPGGYIYVTRGLMALADNEAELAGVIAHEIGHITGRHSAERYSAGVVTGLGAVALGVLTGSPQLAQVASSGAAIYLSSYSRDQEFEADTLGVRYLSRSGHEPRAMSSFLDKLGAHSRLEATLAGRPEAADEFHFMSTHPRTADRVEAAIQAAVQVAVADPIVARRLYLEKIDGMLYGDSPRQGLVRGQVFAHPELKFRFEVPEGFRLINGMSSVKAVAPSGAIIQLDMAGLGRAQSITDYLVAGWAEGVALNGVETFDLNGMTAVTGWIETNTSASRVNLRLIAIRFQPETVVRLVFATPVDQYPALQTALQRTTYSFRRLADSEAADYRPYRLRIVEVGRGESAASLARRLPFDDYQVERFRTLNGLGPGQEPAAGSLVKIVIE